MNNILSEKTKSPEDQVVCVFFTDKTGKQQKECRKMKIHKKLNGTKISEVKK